LIAIPWLIAIYTLGYRYRIAGPVIEALIEGVVLTDPEATILRELFEIPMDSSIQLVHIIDTLYHMRYIMVIVMMHSIYTMSLLSSVSSNPIIQK
jgi:hypothetical protein